MQEKFDFIYVFDPLCGWCYGFSPVVKQLQHAYREQSQIRVFSGGMAIGDRAQPIKDGYGYIKDALPQVSETTGVSFGQGFRDMLEEGSYYYDSEPPSIALKVFKSLKPGQQFAFAHRLQEAIFAEGKDLNDQATYPELLQEFDVDVQEFLKRFRDQAYKDKTYQEFMFVQQLGASGFPTLLLGFEDHLYLVSRGYRPYEELDQVVQKVLSEERAAK